MTETERDSAAPRAPTEYDDGTELAQRCRSLPRPWLIGVDVDGTLAPIVEHPDLSALHPDALAVLDELTRSIGVMVAVVSGRPLADLRHRFGIPASVMLLGSHGAEIGTEADDSNPNHDEALLSDVAADLASRAAALAGTWVEHKPVSVALHARSAAEEAGEALLDDTAAAYRARGDVTVHRGQKVVEVSVSPMSKRVAFEQLRSRLEPATTFFLGDDQSDEHVFESLLAHDVSVKVGTGPTSATNRLRAPDDVVTFLARLARAVPTEPPR